MTITYKTPDDIAKLRIAGRLAADVLAMIGEHVRAGVSTEHLDRLCNDFIVNTLQATPANVGYLGFPKTVCASVNHVVCHGIPSRAEVLKDGDIINIDVAVIKDGYFGDTSRMYCVGAPSTVARQLIDTAYEAMVAGIRQVKPDATLGDVGHAIQKVAQRDGFSIVRDYCGHGIGKVYHEDPQVLHYGQPGQGIRLKPGVNVLCGPNELGKSSLVRAIRAALLLPSAAAAADELRDWHVDAPPYVSLTIEESPGRVWRIQKR